MPVVTKSTPFTEIVVDEVPEATAVVWPAEEGRMTEFPVPVALITPPSPVKVVVPPPAPTEEPAPAPVGVRTSVLSVPATR